MLTSHIAGAISESSRKTGRVWAVAFVRAGVVLAAAGVTACGDGPTSTGEPATAAVLVAASPVSSSSIVGSEVIDLPAVITRDAAGRPVSGVEVTFAVARGGGTARGLVVRSDGAGIARMGGWTLGVQAGENVVTATVPSLPHVEFKVMAAPGPARTAFKFSGDNQVGIAGRPVPLRPQVRVTDGFGNGVSGIRVTYSVSGGGSATGDTLTNAMGLASIAEWRLGAGGAQTLVVTAGDLPPLVFTVRLNDLVVPCGAADTITGSVQRAGEIAASDCVTASGRRYRVYTINNLAAARWELTSASTVFSTALELVDDAGTPVGAANGNSANFTARIDAILPAGIFHLVTTSAEGSATGAYVLKAVKNGAAPASCSPVFIYKSVIVNSVSQVCPGSTVASDVYRIYLNAGVSINVTVTDNSYSGPHLEIVNGAGEKVADGRYASYYVEKLDFTAPETGYYDITVVAPSNDTAVYELVVK